MIIVYKLIKEVDRIVNRKCSRAYVQDDYSKNFLKLQEIHKNYMLQVEVLALLRRKIPYLTDFEVEIDTATLENNTPVQVHLLMIR
ncbi:hypothetical protein CG710_016950 [Lachnotalea glycerini]|uniref:Uncharacterized protein n=1 Tax=Lachnotalea glycerini TaxID=1763509 RepID=A0A371JB85_9FIRM|nr:hypothetical protein CG710_016950 [Lachnotalea glycerini]